MADNYTVVATSREPQVLSATQVIDAMTVGFFTHPHEVYVESTLPYAQVQQIGVNTVVEPLAFNIERLFSDGTVAGASFVQDVDASGLLTGAVDFVVAVPSADTLRGGLLTTTVRLTIKELYLLSDSLYKFADARDLLQTTAAL